MIYSDPNNDADDNTNTDTGVPQQTVVSKKKRKRHHRSRSKTEQTEVLVEDSVKRACDRDDEGAPPDAPVRPKRVRKPSTTMALVTRPMDEAPEFHKEREPIEQARMLWEAQVHDRLVRDDVLFMMIIGGEEYDEMRYVALMEMYEIHYMLNTTQMTPDMKRRVRAMIIPPQLDLDRWCAAVEQCTACTNNNIGALYELIRSTVHRIVVDQRSSYTHPTFDQKLIQDCMFLYGLCYFPNYLTWIESGASGTVHLNDPSGVRRLLFVDRPSLISIKRMLDNAMMGRASNMPQAVISSSGPNKSVRKRDHVTMMVGGKVRIRTPGTIGSSTNSADTVTAGHRTLPHINQLITMPDSIRDTFASRMLFEVNCTPVRDNQLNVLSYGAPGASDNSHDRDHAHDHAPSTAEERIEAELKRNVR